MPLSAAGLILTLALGLLWAPLCADAQQPTTGHRVGWRDPPSPGAGPELDAFLERLRDLGYVEGQNLIMDYRWAAGKEEQLPDVAAALVRLPVDVIVGGAVATRPTRHADDPDRDEQLHAVALGFAVSRALGRISQARAGWSSTRREAAGPQETVPACVAVLATPALQGIASDGPGAEARWGRSAAAHPELRV
jgi:hypothetical protein